MKKTHFVIFATILTLVIISSTLLFLIKPQSNFIQKITATAFNSVNTKRKKNKETVISADKNKLSENKKIRIMIDPGHNSVTKGSKGALGYEYQIAYKVAKLIGEHFSVDKRFEYLLSRDENHYIEPIKQYSLSNRNKLENILETELDFEKRTGALSKEQIYELYSIRHYAIDNDFALLISIHLDYTPNKKRMATTKGFQAIVSPYNRSFISSMKIADTIASNMRIKYKVAPTIEFDKILSTNIWEYYNKETLAKNGIALRSIIVLGDAFEYEYYKNTKQKSEETAVIKDIPSVLMEVAYMHEVAFKNEQELSDVAERIYKSIVQVFYK